jgi:uncharacterized integral membrane protein
MNVKGIVILILLVALVIFTAQNYEVVEVRFLVWSFVTSRALVIFAAMAMGVVIGWLTARRSQGMQADQHQAPTP